MPVRGIRGAIQVRANTRDAIHGATKILVRRMAEENGVRPGDVVSAFFTVTDDLNADFPAYAARDMGWTAVPMLCNREIPVPGAMPRVLRVLLLVNTRRSARAIRPIYVGEAACLRPDLAGRSRSPRRR